MILMIMTKLVNLLSYYVLILVGLIGTSWLIWSRFICTRTIRDIPDMFMTEYRFWILIYICCIYLYAIKTLIKENTTISPEIVSIMKSFREIIYKPLKTLDHFIKYNAYCKPYYYDIVLYIIIFRYKLTDNWTSGLILSFHVIPRIILVVFLFLDTFYFNKLEIFYKIVLIGLLPFIFRYLNYSMKDIYDYWVELLIQEYQFIYIFEKGYRFDIVRKENTEAVWHFERLPIEQYIEVMHDTYLDQIRDKITYEYIGVPICKEEVYIEYELKFKKPRSSWCEENHEKVRQLFEDLVPQILRLKIVLNNLEILKREKKIVWPKIIIFSLYFICWSYILITSYYNYPIELPMFKNLVKNLMIYITVGEDPFNGHIYSLNKNMITIKSITDLIMNLINKIMK